MAEITLTVNATAGQLEKISDYLGWTEKVTDENGDEIDNPESRKEFTWRKTQEWWKECYKAEKAKDGEVARVTALEEAESETSTLSVTE